MWAAQPFVKPMCVFAVLVWHRCEKCECTCLQPGCSRGPWRALHCAWHVLSMADCHASKCWQIHFAHPPSFCIPLQSLSQMCWLCSWQRGGWDTSCWCCLWVWGLLFLWILIKAQESFISRHLTGYCQSRSNRGACCAYLLTAALLGFCY